MTPARYAAIVSSDVSPTSSYPCLPTNANQRRSQPMARQLAGLKPLELEVPLSPKTDAELRHRHREKPAKPHLPRKGPGSELDAFRRLARLSSIRQVVAIRQVPVPRNSPFARVGFTGVVASGTGVATWATKPRGRDPAGAVWRSRRRVVATWLPVSVDAWPRSGRCWPRL